MTRKLFITALALASAAPVLAANTSSTPGEAQDWTLLFKGYPPEALARGEQGAVGYRLSLDPNGNPTACEVTQSSGYATLDNATCRLILSGAEFKGVKDVEGRKVSAQYSGVVNWRLPSSATAAAKPAKTLAKADDAEKLICKRKAITGSLAGFERTCYTKAQWQELADRTRAEWSEIQGAKGSTSGK